MGWLHGRRLPVITPPLLRPHYGNILVSTTYQLHPSCEYISAFGGGYTYYPSVLFFFLLFLLLLFGMLFVIIMKYRVLGTNSSSFEPLGGAYVVFIEKRRYLKYYLTWHVMKI
jgi:hypothetical protein